ncbi:817_t:CDS:2 [Dentiscutata erythropus]|uniref:817_t:CDS:1 n=1 Tax=Dentiscutata erythropus TaxID=1348616 RepID=A0A9N9N9F5_9GLOM|nr:817_t:CDS:2 [Dentiscutata erythropus]
MSSSSFSDAEESNITPSMTLTLFLKNAVDLLGLIERVTRCLCSAKYPTINLVYPYMELLKKRFAPKTNETVETYLKLIYRKVENKENESDESDDNIPTAKDTDQVEYLPSITTDGLLCKLRAAIYLSLDEL